MKKLQFLFSMLFCASTAMYAQTTVIDYSSWSGTTNCNAFGAPTVVGGVQHKSTLGQPKYVNYNDPIWLECTYDVNTFEAKGTEYAISHSFLANHQYKVTVYCASTSTTNFPKLALTYTNSISSSTACTGPAIDTDPHADGFAIYGPNYGNYEYTNTIGAQSQNYLKFRAIAMFYGLAVQKIAIKRITIEDITPNPGTFSITASQNSRACLNTGNITFTANHVTNPNNVTVNTYRFYPEPGQWYYNGSDAPVSIDKPANAPTITLTPRACATNLKVSCEAITNIPLTVNIAPKIISRTIPQFLPSITGPDTIRSYAAATASADYSISLGAISACTQPVWSIAVNPNYIQSVVSSPNTPFTATVTKDPYVYGPVVTLKVALNICGVNTSVTKPIVLDWKQSIFGFIAGKTMLNDNTFSVSPNPVSGNAHVNFGKNIEEGHIDIMSVEGKHVKSLEIKGSSYLDISMDDINPGIYLILVDDGKTQQKAKIVKK
jgi:hypothetical protein